MNLTDFQSIINKLPQNIKTLTLTGGEPLLHKQLPQMLKSAYETLSTRERIFKAVILTSGSVPYDLSKIKKYLGGIILTFKYNNRTLNNGFEVNPESYKNKLSLLAQAKTMHIPISINWVADSFSIDLYKGMLRLTRNYKVPLNVLKYITYNKKLAYLGITEEEWESLVKKLQPYKRRREAPVRIAFPTKKGPDSFICTGGIQRLNILTNGDVTPCLYINNKESILGNLLRDDYETIMANAYEWRLKYKKVKGCIAEHLEGQKWSD